MGLRDMALSRRKADCLEVELNPPKGDTMPSRVWPVADKTLDDLYALIATGRWTKDHL